MKAFAKLVKEVESGRRDPWAGDEPRVKRLTLNEAAEAFLASRKHLRSKSQTAYRL